MLAWKHAGPIMGGMCGYLPKECDFDTWLDFQKGEGYGDDERFLENIWRKFLSEDTLIHSDRRKYGGVPFPKAPKKPFGFVGSIDLPNLNEIDCMVGLISHYHFDDRRAEFFSAPGIKGRHLLGVPTGPTTCARPHPRLV